MEESSSKRIQGIGVRVLVDDVFGFAGGTTDLTEQGILRAVAAAQGAAKTSAGAKKQRIKGLAEASMGVWGGSRWSPWTRLMHIHWRRTFYYPLPCLECEEPHKEHQEDPTPYPDAGVSVSY